MISRALFIALFSAYVTSLAPLVAPDDDDCALYLTGPGRSSAYDYSLNLLKGNFAYDGQHTCITYEAINQAYLDARTRILVSQPKGDWHAEDFASVGELILDISTNLARTYGLTYEEIEKGLPLIDTSRTLIREVCPPVFSHVECRAGKYRRLDGLCNNLQHPTWGATMAPFQRLIGPLFADGINSPRIAHTGRDLPLSRVVSRTMHPDDGFHDHAGTVMVIAWGQFMDHDYTLTGTPLDPINRNDPEECCKRPPHLKHPYCNEIRIPDDDYFYRLFGVKCIDFVRGFPSPRPGCKLGSRVPFNTLTGAIDGNTVYGVTEKFARKLRTGYGGLLRMNPVFKEYGLKDLLPLKLDIPDEGCTRPNKNMYCFEAGEIRVNEQLVLTVMHTLMAREHNRVAKALAEVNPHWDDETLYQEARRINIAEIQHITYNEFLPILLGKDVMEKFGLMLEKKGYWDGYDPEVNPDVIASFAAAAYRFGHSLLPTAVERWSKAHKFIASKRLSDLIRRPYDLYRAGVLDEYVMGLMNQVAQAMDDSITQEVTNHLFKKVGARFGMDLVSFNMQRGREFGLPGYMEFRKFCGLSDAHTFQDLFGSMPNDTLRKYESIFEHPIDIDLWSGGVSERPLRGSMLGPTFACVIATQFSYSRRGDRFWFELPNQPSSFTPEQLIEIRKSRLARIICDNTDIIDTVQLYPMVLPDHELNPRVPCRSGIIPSMDFSKWAEPVPFVGPAKQYITDAIMKNKVILNNTEYDTLSCVNSTVCSTNNNNHVNRTEKCNEVVTDNNEMDILNLETNFTAPQLNDCELNKNKITLDKLKAIKNSNIKENKEPQKTSGHKRNSLRKRRFAPAVYNYVINHDLDNNEKLETEGVVNVSNLANFHIETTHEPYKSDSLNKYNIKNESRLIPVEESASYEHDELKDLSSKQKQSNNRRSSQEIDESSESDNRSGSREIEDSSDSYERNNNLIDQLQQNRTPLKPNSQESSSDERIHDYHSTEYDHKKSKLNDDDPSNINDSNESTENQKKLEPLAVKDTNLNRGSDETYENSNSEENIEPENNAQLRNSKPFYKQTFKNKYESEHYDNSNNSEENAKTQDHQIDNESILTQHYERPIKQNIDESIEQVFSNEKDISIGSQTNSKLLATLKNDSHEISINDSNTHSNENISRNLKTILKINDEEIKPVVEQNNEDISSESSEELKSSHLKVDKPEDQKETNGLKSKKVDLKQQFERIPLDYKHDEAESDEQSETPISNNVSFVDNSKEVDATLPPENEKFDENLNIKFSDISIKLPEIKLPDDILAFNYEEPLHYEKNKPKHIDYSNKDEQPENQKNLYQANDDSDDYRDYFRENYKNKNSGRSDEENADDDNENDDEDLYEKFVRERFGKRKSKDAKKSKYITPNRELYETLQNVLKKTEKIQQEAAKSNDPNAGYAWTLEYGQKL